jgi:hypothetical protein
LLVLEQPVQLYDEGSTVQSTFSVTDAPAIGFSALAVIVQLGTALAGSGAALQSRAMAVASLVPDGPVATNP